MKKVLLTSMVALLFASQFIYSAQLVNGWQVTTDNSGNIQSMKYENPKTQLNTEASIDVSLDYQGVPSKGTVIFRDGVVRTLNYPAEVMTYWDNLHGWSAFWDFMKTQNKVTTIDPQKGPLPTTAFGHMSRVITKDGREYIGKLTEMTINPDWFYVIIEGTSVTVYRLAIREIQQI
jgi:hypothetical protein